MRAVNEAARVVIRTDESAKVSVVQSIRYQLSSDAMFLLLLDLGLVVLVSVLFWLILDMS